MIKTSHVIRTLLPASPLRPLVMVGIWGDEADGWGGWSEPVLFVAVVEHRFETGDRESSMEPVMFDSESQAFVTARDLRDLGQSALGFHSPDVSWETLIGDVIYHQEFIAARARANTARH